MTKECPRCNNPRLIEWFGDPKAPYAICLACRVEINGEEKTAKQEKRRQRFSPNCAICESVISGGEICNRCENGIKAFNSSVKTLGRAASYLGRNLRGRKPKRRKFKQQNNKLQRLIKSQRADARDNHVRFEHAISK